MVDQAQGEVVAVEQADPHSNNIHVAHNNPRDSDIMITQSNPFNTTIHISLNVGTGCKVSISAVVGLYIESIKAGQDWLQLNTADDIFKPSGGGV